MSNGTKAKERDSTMPLRAQTSMANVWLPLRNSQKPAPAVESECRKTGAVTTCIVGTPEPMEANWNHALGFKL